MKFGIVLVVLTMVVSGAFAKDNKSDDSGSWCDADNWGREVPYYDDGDKVRISDGEHIVVDCADSAPDGEDPGADEVELRGDSSSLTVGVAAVEDDPLTPLIDETVVGVEVDLVFRKDLAMSDDSSDDYTVLNIANGYLKVEDECDDLFEDGSGELIVAAGSRLRFKKGIRLGDSNDGTNSVYTFDIAGTFQVEGDRIEHKGGQLIVNQTGGTFVVDDTSRLSMDDDSVVTFNISGGTVELDKVELNTSDDGVKGPFTYSVAVNLSGDGEWNGDNEEIKDEKDGAIFNLDVTGNGYFVTKDFNINEDDGEINITMDSGTIEIQDDVDMNAGDIVITGGIFNVQDDFELGDDGVATITVSGTADVWIDDLYMGEDSELTISDVRMDLDDLKDIDDFDGSIDIKAGGSLVIKNADDEDDLDDINDLVDDGDIFTSSPGMVIVVDYGITNDDRLTIQAAVPVEVDIKPGADPNPLRVNFQGSGVLTVAIVGSDSVDASAIDPGTVTLGLVAALRGKVSDINQDGVGDLVLKFSREAILDYLGDEYDVLTLIPNREELNLVLFGDMGGTLISGSDSLQVLNRGGIKAKK